MMKDLFLKTKMCVFGVTFLLFGNLSAQTTINFSVNQTPLPQVEFEVVYKPDRVSFIFFDSTKVVNETITEWYWDFGDGANSTAQFTSHTYAQMGEYIVCLAIKTDRKCKDTACQVVSSWLGVGTNQTLPHLSIAPNPFSELVNIEFELKRSGDVVVEVFNILGEKEAQLMNGFEDSGMKKVIFNPGEKNTGSYIYFVKIRLDDVVITEKIVRSH